jgi:N-acetylglucosaminyl-diphospho-decaprenol L-rhamnosyltransferase
MPELSVVCVLHDSAAVLPALLASLARHLPAAQLVAVDTDSRDDGPGLAAAAGAEVVRLGANPGFGAASNAGLALALHPATALLNPDCELLDAGLARLAAAASERDALWAPRLVDATGRIEKSAHPLPGTLGALIPALVHPPLLPRPVRLRVEPWRAGRPRTVGWAVGACLVARTRTLRRLGPFDPSHFLFHEDMDLCLRARAAGVPTILDPGVAVRHAGGHATRAFYGGEPSVLLARRRRAVVEANLGAGALARDDLAQSLTFASRHVARRVLGRPASRERAQLAAVREARR